MTKLTLILQRLLSVCTLIIWLCQHHSQRAGAAPFTQRVFGERPRAHLLLVLRAQWYGFDRNETIYLIRLFDETHGATKTPSPS